MSLNFVDGIIAGMLLGIALEELGFRIARYFSTRAIRGDGAE